MLVSFQGIFAQKSILPAKSNSPAIKWVGEISSLDEFQEDKSLIGNIIELIVGGETLNLIKPISLALTDSNKIWILDQGLMSPLLIDKREAEIILINDDEEFTFPSMVGICKAASDKILFTDSKLNKIFICDLSTEHPIELNDTLELIQPTGIAFSISANEIWVVETGAHRISVLDGNGKFIRSIGKRGTRPGEFNFPTFIWIDNNGLVYINDSMNFRVQVLDASGKIISVFGENGDATGYIARSKGIASDSYGNIYVVDALFNTVQIFDIEGNFLLNFGTQGKKDGEFWLSAGIFIDEENKIYVADSYNSRIQIFQLINN